MFGLSSHIRRSTTTSYPFKGTIAESLKRSLKSVQTNSKRNFSDHFFNTSFNSTDSGSIQGVKPESYKFYKHLGINVSPPDEMPIEYMLILREQKDAIHRLIHDCLPERTQKEIDAALIDKLKEKAAKIENFYDRAYIGTETQKKASNNEIIKSDPVYVNTGLNFLGTNRNPDSPAFSIDEKNISKYEKKLKNKNLFTTHDPRLPVDENGEVLSSAQIRKNKMASKKRSPLVEKLMEHYKLTKPRISLMVTATAWWGYFLVSKDFMPLDFIQLTAGTLALSVTASIINQIRETDVDAKMVRTMTRPLVTGKISIPEAKITAGAYLFAGSALLASHPVALGLGLLNVGLYGGLYTSLKRKTTLNTEVGALVGAIPPMMGYFVGLPEGAAWDHDLTALFWPGLIMFTWQMQHVMLICMRRSEEYNRSGLIMQCFNDVNLKSTKFKGISWSVISIGVVLAPYLTGWGAISQIFAVYLWAIYTGAYAKSALAKPINQKGLLTCLYMGYLLLGATILLSVHARSGTREDIKYSYMITSKD